MEKTELEKLKIAADKVEIIVQELRGGNVDYREKGAYYVSSLSEYLELLRGSIAILEKKGEEYNLFERIVRISKDKELLSALNLLKMLGFEVVDSTQPDFKVEVAIAHLEGIKQICGGEKSLKEEIPPGSKEKDQPKNGLREFLILSDEYDSDSFLSQLLLGLSNKKDYTLYPLAMEALGYVLGNKRDDIWKVIKESYPEKCGTDRNHRRLISDYTNSDQTPIESKLGLQIYDLKNILANSRK